MTTKIRFAIITSSMLASAGLIASSSVSHGQSQTQRQTQTHGQAQVQPQTPAVQTPDRIWSFLHAFTPWQSRSQSPNQHRYLPNQSQLTNLQQAQLEQSQLEQAQLHRTQLQRTQLQQTQLQQQAQGQTHTWQRIGTSRIRESFRIAWENSTARISKSDALSSIRATTKAGSRGTTGTSEFRQF